MNYHVVTRWGGSENKPSERRMREIFAELKQSDPEHPDTWLTHESGWTLSIHEKAVWWFGRTWSHRTNRAIRLAFREKKPWTSG